MHNEANSANCGSIRGGGIESAYAGNGAALAKPVTELDDVRRRITHANEALASMVGALIQKTKPIQCTNEVPKAETSEKSLSRFQYQSTEYGQALQAEALVIEGQTERLQYLLESLRC